MCPFFDISRIRPAFLKHALLTALCCVLEKKLSSFLKCSWYLSIWIAWSLALWSCEGIDLAILPLLQHIFAWLSKTAIKTLKQNVKFVQTFFYQVFGCPKINFEPRTERQSHSPNVNQSTFKYYPKVGGSQSLTERIIRIRARNFLILSVTCYHIVSLFPRLY